MINRPTVCVSSVIEADVERVWTTIRDFNALPVWHPLVADSRIEEGRDAAEVGCVRAFTLTDGGKIREQLLALSDLEHSCTYSILESPMQLSDYIATLRLLPITDGNRSYAEWSCCFGCAPDMREELAEHIGQNVFQAGLTALQKRFGA